MHIETIPAANKRYPNFVKVVLADIPDNAPQEVKDIAEKHSIQFGTGMNRQDPAICFTDKRFDKSLYTQRMFCLGEELQTKGYNPSAYGIDMEYLNKQLQLSKVKALYKKLTEEMKDLQYRQSKLSYIERKFFNPFKHEIKQLSGRLAEVCKTIEQIQITQKSGKVNVVEDFVKQIKKVGLKHL